MTQVYVSYLAIFVAAILNMVLGSVWYGPLFGKQWMALMGMSKEKMDSQKNKGGMWKNYLLAFIGSLVMGYVLSHSIVFAGSYLNMSGVQAGMMAGFWSWLGFVAPVTLGTVLWEGKPWKLWFLLNGYYLISLLIMGSVLAMWM